jgi:hypothetical protein
LDAESLATSSLFTSSGFDEGKRVPLGRPSSVRSGSDPVTGIQDDMSRQLFAPDEYHAVARYTAIQRRLVQLEHLLFEESGTRLDGESRKEFLRSVSSNPTVRKPSVSTDPSGKLTATWKKSDGEELSMRFMGRGVTHFSILTYSRPGQTEYEQRWGTARDPVSLFASDPLVRRIAS